MATVITFTRNRPPHFAGDKIGTDRLTAERLVSAGYASYHDLEAEARASVPKPVRTVEAAKAAKPADPATEGDKPESEIGKSEAGKSETGKPAK